MRRWTVERHLLSGHPARLSAELSRRMPAPTSVLLLAQPRVSLEMRASIQPSGPDSAWLVVIGAYPTPRGVSGPLCDVATLCAQAEERVAELVKHLAQELQAAVPPPFVPQDASTGRAAPIEVQPVLVRDIMDTDAPAFDEDLDVSNAYSLLLSTNHDGAPVVNSQGRLLGMLSDRDLMAGMLRGQSAIGRVSMAKPQTVGELCSRPAVVTVPEITALRAAQQMLYHGVRRLAVIEEGRLVGVVTRTTLLAALHEDLESDAIAGLNDDLTLATAP